MIAPTLALFVAISANPAAALEDKPCGCDKSYLSLEASLGAIVPTSPTYDIGAFAGVSPSLCVTRHFEFYARAGFGYLPGSLGESPFLSPVQLDLLFLNLFVGPRFSLSPVQNVRPFIELGIGHVWTVEYFPGVHGDSVETSSTSGGGKGVSYMLGVEYFPIDKWSVSASVLGFGYFYSEGIDIIGGIFMLSSRLYI